MPLTRTRILLTLGALLLLAFPVSAEAAPSRKKSIWGPATVNGRSQFPIYRDLGVGIWQDRVNWSVVAPTRPADPRDPLDPAYRWPAGLDDAIAEGRRFGIQTSLVLTEAPRWASGHSNPSWAPRKPSDFADFAYAASARYPSVRHWMIWSEPTRAVNFMPLIHEKRDRPLTRRMKKGPHTYARILDAAYAALKRRSRRNIVIGGNSFTTGDVSALNWIRNLRLPNGKPPRLDLYGHNPFSARRPLLDRPPLGHGFADFSDLDLLARWVDRWLARPRGKTRINFFLSELFWPTDHPNHEFNFWVTRRTAASWLTDALRITRRWPRIYTLGWYALYDDPPNGKGDEVNRGLLTYRGRKKPAYRAYRRG
jgi:glutathione S-transferase